MKEHKARGSDGIHDNAPMPGLRSHARRQWNKGSPPSSLQDENGKKKGVSSHWKAKLLMFAFLSTGFVIVSRSCAVLGCSKFALHQGSDRSKSTSIEGDSEAESNRTTSPVQIYSHLLNLALDALVKNHHTGLETLKLWKEPYGQAALWKPCVNSNSTNIIETSKVNGRYILVSANGGLNQQRVAICNAVAVAALLNATLVLPKFLYSNVWKDPSQFGDIYQEDYFIKTMKREIKIVKELPLHLKPSSIDIITDSDLSKEAKPDEYIDKVLPILQKNGAVHFLGFGNRLGFDPIPLNLQRMRCKCNFHALKFVPKIQRVGSLLIKRMRRSDATRGSLDRQLLGSLMSNSPSIGRAPSLGPRRYLALHLRFEVDMVAYSMCDFGGGENERRKLQAYREKHFPLMVQRLKHSVPVSPEKLRRLGRCPLTPEEAALVLAAVGFERRTYIYVAGSSIYGGMSRMQPLYNLYPNVVTKEDLLTPSELAPFKNFSSQQAALDFIACAAADVFAMTDSGSQLSSLVSGFRTYHGGGRAPTLRPNKKWLAAILSKNATIIGWRGFKIRVQKMIAEGQKIQLREFGQSIYRKPRSPVCMCK